MGSTGTGKIAAGSTQLAAGANTTTIINYYKTNYGIDIGGSWFKNGGDSQILIETSRQLDRLKAEIGSDVFSEMGVRITSHTMRSKGTFAYTDLLSHQVVVNSPKYSDFSKGDAAVQKDVKSHFHPNGVNIGSTIVHEIGHNIEFLINRRLHSDTMSQRYADATQEISKAIVKAAYADIKKANPTAFKTEKQARASISGYADSTWRGSVAYTETMAEAVSDYAANGSNANPMSIAIWNNIKTMLK